MLYLTVTDHGKPLPSGFSIKGDRLSDRVALLEAFIESLDYEVHWGRAPGLADDTQPELGYEELS